MWLWHIHVHETSLEAYCMVERVLNDFSLQARPLLPPVASQQPQLALGTVRRYPDGHVWSGRGRHTLTLRHGRARARAPFTVTSSVLVCAIWNFFKTHACPHVHLRLDLNREQQSFTADSPASLTMLRKFQTLWKALFLYYMVHLSFNIGHLRFCQSTSGSGDTLLQEAAKVNQKPYKIMKPSTALTRYLEQNVQVFLFGHMLCCHVCTCVYIVGSGGALWRERGWGWWSCVAGGGGGVWGREGMYLRHGKLRQLALQDPPRKLQVSNGITSR